MAASTPGVFSTQQFTDLGGPLVGGRLYTFTYGTTAQKVAYTDINAAIPHTYTSDGVGGQYIALNARGELPAPLYLVSGSYDLALKRADGSTVWTRRADPAASDAAFQTFKTDLLAGIGAAQVGFDGALNYTALTIGARLIDLGASPRSFGGTGDGVVDDTAFIRSALTYSRVLDLRGRSWKITSTITLASNTTILMDSANIVAVCGATPVFQFINAATGLNIHHGCGAVTGTASSFLFCQGSTNTPTSFAHYASLINLYNLRINSNTITTALVFDKAVNSVNIISPNFFCPNGIDDSGAGIAVNVINPVIYSSSGLAGTRGIKIRSTGGTTYFNQGWQVIGGTLDNFEITHDVADVYQYTVTGGYHGVNAALAASTGYAFQFQAPTGSNLTDTITIGGGAVIAGRTRFAASAGGQAYNADIEALWVGVPGTAVAVENNAANIAVHGKWKAGSGTAIGMVGSANNAKIIAYGDFDGTYTNGFILNGAVGADCVIGPVSGPTTGDIVGAGRSNILFRGISISTTGVLALNRAFSASNITGAFGVAANISVQAWAFAKGETGDIVISLPYSGANAATQALQIILPAGMNLASGTGYSAGLIYLGAATGLVSVKVPYWCNADGSGNVQVTNFVGNALTINNQGYCGIVRNWS